jgi:tRNA U34 5-carboxymethylaminomethyl modifying GTPase MnmE/TrmE
LILIDSAGIRKTENPVEMEGIKKSNEEIEKAGLVIWVSAADERIYEEEKEWIEVLKIETRFSPE